jgi:hypothetical protein
LVTDFDRLTTRFWTGTNAVRFHQGSFFVEQRIKAPIRINRNVVPWNRIARTIIRSSSSEPPFCDYLLVFETITLGFRARFGPLQASRSTVNSQILIAKTTETSTKLISVTVTVSAWDLVEANSVRSGPRLGKIVTPFIIHHRIACGPLKLE